MTAASSGSTSAPEGEVHRRMRGFGRRVTRAVPASADLVLGPGVDAARHAAAAAGAERSATLLAVDGTAEWQDAVPSLDPEADRRAIRSRTVVVTAASRSALARMLAPARFVGDAARVVVAIPETDEVVDGELLAPPPLTLRVLPPRVTTLRHARRKGHVLLEARYVNAGPVDAVLRGVAMAGDTLARGRGAGGLQIAVAGAAGLDWVAGDPRARLVDPSWEGQVYERAGRSLDAVLVDEGWDDDEQRSAIIEEARALGAEILRVPSPRSSRETDRRRPGRTAAEVPPVDLSVCRPTGFRANDDGSLLAVATDGDARGEVLTGAAAGEAVSVERLRPWVPLSPELVDAAHSARAVVDHPALHTDPVARARVLAGLAAAGAPLVLLDPGGPFDGPLAELLGEALLSAATQRGVDDLADPLDRERHSVEVRRVALSRHGPEARWRELRWHLGLPSRPPRTVSVVASTNRPDMLGHLAAQLARQHHGHAEAVVALHGDGFPAEAEEQLREAAGMPVTVLRPQPEATLGAVLDALTDAASGDLVTKMDDDDWYGPHHLTDLELAWQYSDGTVVGKAAEFVHLTDLDVTIRRFVGGAESGSDRIAGGTLLISRPDLRSAGGWRDAPRAVDRLLIDDVRAVGGDVYRTHPFGFVLTRRPSGHTWDVGAGYFLRQSGWQQRGLALDAAGIHSA